MASVSSVSSGNASSLYGNRNVISGLASGMDTESMIENAVSGIRTKISGLLQKQTKLSWKQEAYWNVTDKLVQFSRKYSSYTSSTNLMSAGFFNKAVTTSTSGANSSKVSATGKTNSNVVIDGVAQLASASRYQIKGGGVLDSVNTDSSSARYVEGSKKLNLAEITSTSNLQGSLSLNYGSKLISLNFTSGQVFESVDKFADEIKKQLDEETLTMSDGSVKKGSELIDVTVENGKISFSDKSSGGNQVYINSTSGKLNETLGKPDYDGDPKISNIDLSGKTEADLKTDTTVLDRIEGKVMSFTLDGTKKTITLPTKDELAAYKASNPSIANDEDALVAMMNDKLNAAFGTGKVKASLAPATNADGSVNPNAGALQFTATKKGSNLVVSSDINKAMGLKEQETTYLNTGKTLGDFLGGALTDDMLIRVKGDQTKWKPVEDMENIFTDEAGNYIYKDPDNSDPDTNNYRVNSKGEKLYSLTINGEQIGAYSKDTALETLMVDINANASAGVSVTYSKTTNQFVFTASETGEGHDITIGKDGVADDKDLGKLLFGKVDQSSPEYTKGKDAIVKMTVNGSSVEVTRSTNTFDVDGLSVTVKGTFNGSVDASGNATFNDDTDDVTFTTKADSDKIVDAIKSFVEDYNEMVKAVRDGFATMPLQKSDKSRYEPLTDDDMEGMSDSAIDSYNEKAKTGVLFGDSDLTALYSKLTSAIAPAGSDGTTLRNIGINTEYSGGLTTISLDEEALRTALENNPDSVRDAFAKTAGSGSETNGMMVNLRRNLDTYAATEGVKGILINKAGSKYSATSLLQNALKTQIEAYDEQVDKWQTKLSDKVDYYTSQFSRLEQLISQMNSQSANLQSMMGGG